MNEFVETMYHDQQAKLEAKRTEDIVKQVVTSISGNGAPTGGVSGIQAAILSTTEQRSQANQILTLQKQLKESESANQPTAASKLAKDQAMEELKDALKESRAIAAAATAAATAANTAIAKLNAANAATSASTLGLVTNATPGIADLLRLLQQQNTQGSTSSNSHNNSNGNSNNSSNNSNNGNNSNDSHNDSHSNNNGNNNNGSHNNNNSSNSSNNSNNGNNNNNSGKRSAGSSIRRPGSKKSKHVAFSDFDIDYDAVFRDQSEHEREQDEIEQGETGYTNTLDGNELNIELKKHKADRGTKRALATTVQALTANIRLKNKSTVNQKKNLQLLLNTYEIPTPDPWNVTIAREWLALHYITHGMPIDK